jgi:hypothetical protein
MLWSEVGGKCGKRRDWVICAIAVAQRFSTSTAFIMFAARRALFSPSVSLRKFSTSPARLATYQPRTAPSRYAATKTVARAATSEATGQGNPDIVEGFPSTADEIDVDAIMGGTPSRASSSVPARAVENGGGLSLEAQFGDEVPEPSGDQKPTDWYTSYHGLSAQPFPKEAAEILMAPIEPMDVEIKPGELAIRRSCWLKLTIYV